MNYAIVFRLLGYVMLIEGALLLLPAAASWIYGEWFVLGVFLITAAVSAAIGYALRGIKPKSKMFYMREGFAATSLSWIVISIVGAVPFVVAGCIPNPVDALFETVSGFTTTGASILPGVEDLPKGILFWRSFTHWIGGMGVLVFLLSLLPLTGGSHVNLMKAESPGPQVDKLVPKVQSTAKILYGIYFALTVLEVVFLLLGGMPLFESMLTAFGTAGTGGFGFKNDSFTSFSPYIQWVVTIFMILFGVNFNAYFLLLLRKFNRAISEEVRGYFAIILVAIGIITANIYSLYNSFGEAVRQAAFQVGSIITTTGFSSCDFDLWPTLSKEILVVLMFIGACAGSTGDGKADLAGLAGTGQVFYSTNLATWTNIPGALSKLVAGDFNGDGKADLAGLAGNGQIFYSTNLATWINIPGQLSKLVAGNFNGDAYTDLAGLTGTGLIYYTTGLSTWINIPGTLSALATH